MKKTLMTLAAVLCCTLTTTLLSSCNKGDDVNYIKGYAYEISDGAIVGNKNNEYRTILNALNQAIGYNGNMYESHPSIIDDQMIAACDAVKARFTDVQSTYLSFPLVRVTLDPAPGADYVRETIATYTFGKALTTPYAIYSFESYSQDFRNRLDAIRDNISEEVYTGSRRSQILIRTQYKNILGNMLTEYVPEQESQVRVLHICDSIADAHMSDTMAVEINLSVSKKTLFGDQYTEIWHRTLPANM